MGRIAAGGPLVTALHSCRAVDPVVMSNNHRTLVGEARGEKGKGSENVAGGGKGRAQPGVTGSLNLHRNC